MMRAAIFAQRRELQPFPFRRQLEIVKTMIKRHENEAPLFKIYAFCSQLLFQQKQVPGVSHPHLYCKNLSLFGSDLTSALKEISQSCLRAQTR
jgi:hypothetical protein